MVSGIRPTGKLHLGNFFGAYINFLKMQDQCNCFFFIADYHSLTTHPTPNDLRGSVKRVLAEYLALGLDPEKSAIYVQSDLPETSELYLLLNMSAYVGELEKEATFKEKVRTQPDNVNAGLLTYPVLMAADILIHRAHLVPVGKDQEQHLEMARNFAQRVNYRYKIPFFPEPEAYGQDGSLVKVPGLTGGGKMSKSNGEADTIYLNEDADALQKKIMRAVTDVSTGGSNIEKPVAVQNLFQLLTLVSKPETVLFFEDQWKQGSIRYGDFKKQLAIDMEDFIAPKREAINTMLSNDNYLLKVADMGKEKAHESAKVTMNELRQIIGFRKFY